MTRTLLTPLLFGFVQARRGATFAPRRIEALPTVPTIAESGYKEFEYEVWFGMVAPAKTPKELVSQLSGWLSAALRDPDVKQKLLVQGLYPIGVCGAEYTAFLRKEFDDYGRGIREGNIKAE